MNPKRIKPSGNERSQCKFNDFVGLLSIVLKSILVHLTNENQASDVFLATFHHYFTPEG